MNFLLYKLADDFRCTIENNVSQVKGKFIELYFQFHFNFLKIVLSDR